MPRSLLLSLLFATLASATTAPMLTRPAPQSSIPPTESYPFQNADLPIEERVNDLVSRLTLEEKVGQMQNAAPAIERLGISAYNWWNEALHGVARTRFKTTVFPQAIGLAATFDRAAMLEMATITSDEARAVHQESIRRGQHGIYQGLTFWTPNINIFRDPRWGRGQETYGEDPYLTGQIGTALVQGFQGDDPKYLKVAACAKHYAVHSGPEISRHFFNAATSSYDLWDTYLPAFRDLVVDAKVASVMCAYNAYAGQPCCGNDLLMTDILYKKWQFKGYVTSDCGGVTDFFTGHKTDPDAATASADAVLHGTDLECGNSFPALVDAVRKGLISEAQLDVAVKHLFRTRFQLGMFDPVERVKYAQIPLSVLESAPHQAHALKMARESIVLLKNEAQTLPLRGGLRKIVVLGPNADNKTAQLGNYNGNPTTSVTPLAGIRAKVGSATEVVYIPGSDYTSNVTYKPLDLSGLLSFAGKPGVQAEYFQGRDLAGKAVRTRLEPGIDRAIFTPEEELVPGLKAQNASARFTSTFTAGETGLVDFAINGDDGYRFYIDGKLVVDKWTTGASNDRYTLLTEAGRRYELRLEYYQATGPAIIQLQAYVGKRLDLAKLTAQVKDADAIVYVGGISPRLEGEEMPVQAEGFRGGDRTTIGLPAAQTEVLKVLRATGRPVVLTLLSGSAIGLPWESANLPAIVQAWYGGQAAGTALADVLFGDYNPAGRLPVTFYESEKQLPPFGDYNMQGRTYRYFTGKPSYAFGHGLSYTTFAYSGLKAPKKHATGQPLTVRVDVQNTGTRPGEEVVQLYVRHPRTGGPVALHALAGFERISLQPGEKKTVTFTLIPRQLSRLDAMAQRQELPEQVILFAGGGQPLPEMLTSRRVQQTTVKLTGLVFSVE